MVKSRKKESRFNAPWSNEGWYPEHVRRNQDPEIQKVIASASRGRINPLGFSEDRAFVATTPAFHNPYITMFISTWFVAVGIFLFAQLSASLIGAFFASVLFWAGGLFLFVTNAIRIPAWHRARIGVRTYLESHEGVFPKELRWYS